MKKIQMVDLKGQYEKIKEEVDRGIHQVIDSTQFVNGQAVKDFQSDLEKYLGAKHVIPCANGTDALQVAMMSLGLKPGDEVITSDFTFVATVEVIALLGLTPVLVDVDPDTFNIDPVAIERALTPKTKAIVPVHLFGQSADMDAIMKIAKRHNLFVIEDNCQAIGSDYTSEEGWTRKTGTIGHLGCTSFFPSKNLGCYGDGGAIFTNDDELAHQLRGVVNHGMFVRYYHDYVGVNSRLDSIQAAVLNAKLPHLDDYCAARRNAADFYDKAFANHPNLIIPKRAEKSTHVFHQYTLRCKGIDRTALIDFLGKHDIPAMIYYPVPLHMQKAYIDPRYKEGDFPVTEALSLTVFSLPMHTELDEQQLLHITSKVLEFLG
ncbi:MAG TPA: transcriptional regulator [Bacteroidales bacterium]|nr:MAG: transcriptional regulator [Bacteroidetes bacterium GWE2_42_24]OFY31598.1 MAG: transcriptional regulator [Bacteroidetes bacterium GWF2_43_11]HAQ64404.1 transcriptional regulator [Bacteroidales bacterium]HBZ67146.1 transcriptional regulator [Bacteroidales bacterium]